MPNRFALPLLCAALTVGGPALADHPSGGGDEPPPPSGGAEKPQGPSFDRSSGPSGSDKGSDDNAHTHDDAESEVPVFQRGAVALSAHLLPISTGFYGIGGDVALNSWLSVGLVAQYYRRNHDVPWSGAGAELGAQLFIVGSVFRGLYLSPRVALHSINSDDPRAAGRRWVPGGGATIGFQWAGKIGLSFRVGIGVNARRGRVDGDTVTVPFDGVGVAADGAIGWVF